MDEFKRYKDARISGDKNKANTILKSYPTTLQNDIIKVFDSWKFSEMIFGYAEMGNDDYEGEQYSWKDWVKKWHQDHPR